MISCIKQAIASCFARYGTVELVPKFDAFINSGVVRLALSRNGKEIPLGDEDSPFPTLDLARAGIQADSRTREDILTDAADYLKGKRFDVAPDVPFDAMFCWQAFMTDRMQVVFMLVNIETVALQARLPFARISNPDLLKEAEQKNKNRRETMYVSVSLKPRGRKTIAGLELSQPMRLFRAEVLKILAPVGSTERKVLEIAIRYLELRLNLDENLKRRRKRRQKFWFLPKVLWWALRRDGRKFVAEIKLTEQELGTTAAALG